MDKNEIIRLLDLNHYRYEENENEIVVKVKCRCKLFFFSAAANRFYAPNIKNPRIDPIRGFLSININVLQSFYFQVSP